MLTIKEGWQVWAETSDMDAVDLARAFEGCGVTALIVTDIARDGMKTGVNVEFTSEIANAVSIPVIASGGAGKLEHMADVIRDGKADAVLAASIFHFGEYTVRIIPPSHWLLRMG